MGPEASFSACYAGRVIFRRLLLVLGSLTSLAMCAGCADFLGLGELTYGEPEPVGSGGETAGGGTAASSSGGQTAAGSGGEPIDFGGSGGAAEPPPSLDDEYPANLPQEALLVGSYRGIGASFDTEGGSFWVYVPENGQLLPYALSVTEPDQLGESSAEPGWDLLLAPVLDGVELLFGYESATGMLRYGQAPRDDREFGGQASAGSPGWTHLVLAGDPDEPLLVAADRASRLYRVGPADPTLEDPLVHTGTWDADFTEIVAFEHAGDLGIARLDSEAGTIDFLPFVDGDLGAPESLGAPPLDAWTLAESFTHDGRPGLVLYRSGDGSVTTWLENSPESASEPQSTSALWRRGLTSIVPLHAENAARAVTYDRSTGIGDLVFLEPLENDSIVIK